MSLLPASIKRIGSKATEKRWRHHFPHYKSMRAFCCHGYQSFEPICLKTLCSLSPAPVMLHIEFDQDWPTGFRDIQVWKCGGRRRMDDRPLVYYKLIETTIIHQDLWLENLSLSLTRDVNLATQSSASSADEIRESGRTFQSLIVPSFLRICMVISVVQHLLLKGN